MDRTKEEMLENARHLLEIDALRYARMLLHKEYIDPEGNVVCYCTSDEKMMLDSFEKTLKQSACNLLKELSRVGLPKRK